VYCGPQKTDGNGGAHSWTGLAVSPDQGPRDWEEVPADDINPGLGSYKRCARCIIERFLLYRFHPASFVDE